MRIGVSKAGFNGPVPIEYSDILAWCQLAGISLYITECESIVFLSSSYVKSFYEHKDPHKKPPSGENDDGTYDQSVQDEIIMKQMMEAGF